MKKRFLIIPLLLIGWLVIADNNFPDFPMTIYGDIKIWTTNLPWWTLKVYDSSEIEIASFDITTAWKYWSNLATETHLLLNKFTWSLTFKVTYNSKTYVVDSIDDSNKWEWCPSKDSITFVSADCRYDIVLKEKVVTPSNPWWWGWWGWGGWWWGGWGWWGWWGGWGWWGWWGWGGWWSSNNNTTTSASNTSTTDTSKVESSTEQNTNNQESNSQNDSQNNNWNSNDNFRYQAWDQSEKLANWFTREFNNSYIFAFRNWITTMDDISKADMNWPLTRIAMAKMLSNYAINVLWNKPANKVVPKFPDVDEKLNEDYGWAVDLAYQLWIMWIWIDKFRPYDPVKRWEFWTALSRMLFGLADWTDNYYSTHLKELKKRWIISNDNPNLEELRWYVMLMLMRSAM